VGPDYANAPDAELIGAGRADAFAVVYDRHAAAIYNWARSRVGDHAADLTAETFARAWLSRGSFRDGAPRAPRFRGCWASRKTCCVTRCADSGSTTGRGHGSGCRESLRPMRAMSSWRSGCRCPTPR
jgi:hypothetical protein